MKKILAALVVLMLISSTASFAKTIKTHYPNGQLKSVKNVNSHNKLNGGYKYYWPNGKLMEQGRYKNGYHVGAIKRYSIDGELLGQ